MKNNGDYKDALKNLVLVSQIGISMIASIFLGVFIGQFLDGKLGTNGIFTIVLMIIGVGGGFVNLFKIIKSVEKKGK